MTTVELRPETGPRAEHERWYGHAFGVALDSPWPFPGLQELEAAPARTAAWREATNEEVEGAWRADEGEILLERRHPDGRLFLRIERGPDGAYRIWAPYYGRHLVSADGGAVASALPRVPPARWQRLFFAQVLPLTSALHGLTLFHASAVALDGRVRAFIGSSGSGKTSVAAHLVALGASFVTDDVLALEARDSTVLAHPGPARMSIEEAELRQVPSTQEPLLGPCVGRSDKLMLETPLTAVPLEVDSVYFLRPEAAAPRIAIGDGATTPGPSLLGSSFLHYVDSREYLTRHLEVCAALDRSTRLHEITIPRGTRARDVAARVLAHCRQG